MRFDGASVGIQLCRWLSSVEGTSLAGYNALPLSRVAEVDHNGSYDDERELQYGGSGDVAPQSSGMVWRPELGVKGKHSNGQSCADEVSGDNIHDG